MSARHKKLLRRAAEEMVTARDNDGMCYALAVAFSQVEFSRRVHRVYRRCKKFAERLYRDDSEYRDYSYWMGPHFTPEQQQHRVMALLFAAECFDDMEGV